MNSNEFFLVLNQVSSNDIESLAQVDMFLLL